MLTADQEKQLAELTALKAGSAPAGTGAAGRFGPAAAGGGALPKEIGLMVPIEIETGRGKVTCHLLYDESAAANPRELVERLIREGYPVKAWQPNNNGGGGGGRGYGGGGYQRQNRF